MYYQNLWIWIRQNQYSLNLICLMVLCGGFTIQVEAQESEFADNFPTIQVLKNNSDSQGVLFSRNGNGAERFATIYDTDGTLVFAQNTNIVTCLHYYPEVNKIGYYDADLACFIILNSKFEAEDTICTVNGQTDLHDMHIYPNNDKIVYTSMDVVLDLSDDLTPNDTARLVKHFVIEKWNDTGQPYLFWNTMAHFDITDKPDYATINNTGSLNLFHLNSIEPVNDSIVLLSFRNIDQIAKVNLYTNEVIWRLGGNRNDFTFVNDDRGFTDQHNVRLLPNGNITIFDNGNFHEVPYSSMVEYELDEVNMTATLVRRSVADSVNIAGKKGGGQRLSNGNDLIDWGQNISEDITVSEVTPDGETVWEAFFTKSNYRITKYDFKSDLMISVDSLLFTNSTPTMSLNLYNNGSESIKINGIHLRSEDFVFNTVLPVTIPAGQSADFDISYQGQDVSDALSTDVLTLHFDTETRRIGHQVELIFDPTITALETALNDNQMQLYPNPTKDKLMIRFDQDIPSTLVFYDALGVALKEFQPSSMQLIDIADWATGVYYVACYDNMGQATYRRFVKL